QVLDQIGIIRVNNAPVNAISQPVREGILSALQTLNNIAECRVIILHCDGRTFFAGADIKEFNQPPLPPHLPDVVLAIRNSKTPVIAALHGTTLGGGFEIALACHYRTAISGTKVGLPEVNLGLIPGAGGTQLLPTVVGMTKAIDMITSGKPQQVDDLATYPLFDKILDKVEHTDPELLLKQNIKYALQLIVNEDIIAPTSADSSDAKVDWDAKTTEVAKKASGREAPLRALEVMRATEHLNLTDGMQIEREAFLTLKQSAQSQSLRHAFAAEKKAVKFNSNTTIRSVTTVAVIGGGTMGTGIATALLNADFQVILVEQSEPALTKAQQTIATNLHKAHQRGLISLVQQQSRLQALSTTIDMAQLNTADLVIEAIFEDLDLKIDLFKRLESICKASCIFASNTSYLDLNAMATSISDYSRLIGLHFFSPAHIMKLVEVVRTDYVAEDIIHTAFELAKRCRKLPVLVGNCFGFAGNRMYTRYGREVQQMLLEGATVEQIDSAMIDFGMAMGPLQVQDLAGIDVGHRARAAQPFPSHDPGYFKASAMLVEHGHLGRKTGKGFYCYEDGQVTVDTKVDKRIRKQAKKLGIKRLEHTKESIQTRALMALISEGYQIYNEGIIERLSDLDVIWLNGYGFPRYKGGPMFQAQLIGEDKVKQTLAELRTQFGEKIWPR
ncbi:MAG: 3-hydroxyacyl-CoA dehydrogenase, partial [Enterobacterales bacterium]|nr:3-hydroxyacyl-CoA dehydrogenase [Enterobacterales bacterium]